MAHDLDAALDFYGAVMDWTFQAQAGVAGEEYRIASAAGVPVAGIGALVPASETAVAWTPYFAVADADETAGRIRERGATVAVGPSPCLPVAAPLPPTVTAQSSGYGKAR